MRWVLFSLSFYRMKFTDFLAHDILCHRCSWWSFTLFFFSFHWYPCWSLWLFFFWVFRYLWPINFTIYVHSSCHWLTVINMFDKMPQWKDYVIFKEFGYRLFIQLVYFHEKSLVQSSRLILGHVITWTPECCLTLICK